MSKTSYIPRIDEDFDSWQKSFMTITVANATSWGIPPAEVTALTTLQTSWTTAFAAGGKGQKTTRTSQQTKAKTVARKAFEKPIRVFVKRWIAVNPLVSDAQRIALRVTVFDTVRTREGRPASIPDVNISYARGGQLVFKFRQEADATTGKSKRGKPAGVHGMKIYYKLNDPSPVTADDCNKSQTFTRSPGRLVFSPADAGKKFYAFCCWINSRQEEGPFTQLLIAVIPG